MAEILSQSEIDLLLAALSSGELAPDKPASSSASPLATMPEEESVKRTIKVYDFKRQNKFSKDHIRTLSMIHEAFARILSTTLSGQLRMLVQVEVVSVEQLTFDEYSRSLPSPTILNVFSMEPLVGTALFEVNIDLTSAIIDRMLGGPGRVTRIRRDLTDIERTLISSVTLRILSALSEAWQNVINFSPKLETLEMNPRFIQIVPPSDPIVLITFEAKFGENTGPLSLCIPYIMLEPIMGKISAQAMFATARQSQSESHRVGLKDRVVATQVPVQVVLGESVVSVEDVLSLTVGDVLTLDASVGDDLAVLVGERRKFTGRPGTVRNKMAIQISEVLDDKEGEE